MISNTFSIVSEWRRSLILELLAGQRFTFLGRTELWGQSYACHRVDHPSCPHRCSGGRRRPHSCTACTVATRHFSLFPLACCRLLCRSRLPWQCLRYADEAKDVPNAAISAARLSQSLGPSIPVRTGRLSTITPPVSSTAPAQAA